MEVAMEAVEPPRHIKVVVAQLDTQVQVVMEVTHQEEEVLPRAMAAEAAEAGALVALRMKRAGVVEVESVY
jgi:hypothetical protein